MKWVKLSNGRRIDLTRIAYYSRGDDDPNLLIIRLKGDEYVTEFTMADHEEVTAALGFLDKHFNISAIGEEIPRSQQQENEPPDTEASWNKPI